MKQKLTLSVDKEVVKKAKELGINISELTEKVLASFTFEPSKDDALKVKEKYKELFDLMLPMLSKLGVSVVVGEIEISDKEGQFVGLAHMELLPSGQLYIDDFETYVDIDRISVNDLLPPSKILEKFIDALIRGMESTKKTVRELELTKKLVKVIVDHLESK